MAIPKELKKMQEDYQLESLGNTTWGNMNEFQISTTIENFGQQAFKAQIFTYLSEEEKEKIKNYLKSEQKKLKLATYTINEYGVFIALGVVWTMNTGAKTLRVALESITGFMKTNGFKNYIYCPFSGEEMVEKEVVNVGSFKAYMSKESAEKIKEMNAKAEEEYQNAPNNYLKGTLGAICGGAIGAIAWIVIGLFGFVSGWIAVLISYLAGLGYDKMKGKPNATKIIIAVVVTLVYIVVSMFIIYIIAVAMEMKEYSLDGNPVSMLFKLLEQDDDLKTEFILNLIMGIFFGLIGIAISIVSMRKTLHKKQN